MKISLKHLLTGLAMLAAAGLAIAITPTSKIADQGPKIDLETMIPKQFGEWKLDETIVPIAISPDAQAALDRIYNQTLSRTYVNGQGEKIMLSIAYGGDQSDGMAVHKPQAATSGALRQTPPSPYPLDGTTRLQETAAKSLVIPQAGEGTIAPSHLGRRLG